MQSPKPRPSARLGIALVLSIVLGCDSVGPGNEIANSSSDAKQDVVTTSVQGLPYAQSHQATVKVIARIPANLENILSADDVKAALGRKDIRSIRMSPIARGYWRHQFDVGNNAPFRLFISENERMKSPEEEGWDHSEPIAELGEQGRASTGIIESEFIGNSDEKVVSFKRGRYLVSLISVSRESDSGHAVTKDQLIDLARLVDSRLVVSE